MKTSLFNNRTLRTVLLTGVIIAPLQALHATGPLAAGVVSINGSFIEAYQAEFDLVLVSPDGEPKSEGYWTDNISHVERDDKTMLRREVARFTAEGDRDLWRVHLADATTLEPSLMHDRTGKAMDTVTHLDFNGTSISATLIQSPESQALSLTKDLEAAPYDLSLWAPLLMSVPREAGSRVEIPVLGPGLVLASETITVHGQVALKHPSGQFIETWKISTTNRPWTLWVMDEAPYIVRIDKDLGEDQRLESWLRMD
jgi:hypothetical protein